ncbi:hypothetical protein HAX54_018907, partial [Datura stramonium]|nr:hypothetical protein [Datura stramonium]
QDMSLNYVAPVMKNEEKAIELNIDEVDKVIKEWKQTLILCIVGESPTTRAIERYIATQFASLDDRNELLYSGPHMLHIKPIIVKIWSADFDFNKEMSASKVNRISFGRVLVEMDVASYLPK